jgi:predicted metal-dependent hydrolase
VQLTLPFAPAAPELRFEFVRARRARRYILRVRPDGSFRVTIPRGGSRREAESFVAAQRGWAERERTRVLEAHAPAVWREGDEILLRGGAVRIRIERSLSGASVVYGDRRVALRSAEAGAIRAAIERDLRDAARGELIPRLEELAAEQGLTFKKVVVRNQRSRWGSCSHSGTIALNFRLVQMPPAIRDYVLVHELVHLRQQNHSRRFWRLVEQAYPDFRAAERWLKTEGRKLI